MNASPLHSLAVSKQDMTMIEAPLWRNMASAPKDGTRVLVTIRSVEQGSADVDVAYWASEDSLGIEGWRADDSHPGSIIPYADPEIICWMPLPGANDAAALQRPAPWEGDDPPMLDGAGI